MNREVIDLIRQIVNENPLWGVPRIHGEIKKLGFDISESTVQRYIPKRGGRTTVQRWKTFLKNHSKEIISIDFLTVPTIYFNVTKNPNPAWTLEGRPIQTTGTIDKIPFVNGLHHYYFRQAA